MKRSLKSTLRLVILAAVLASVIVALDGGGRELLVALATEALIVTLGRLRPRVGRLVRPHPRHRA